MVRNFLSIFAKLINYQYQSISTLFRCDAILFVMNVVVMLIIGRINPRKEAYVQEYTNQIDIIPWKHLKTAGLAICAIVIAVYIA